MRFKSQVLTAASGSVGGLTYSHNAGGMYTRARAIPVNPGSVYQQVIRGHVAFLVAAWSNVLDGTQRAAWDNYAAEVALSDVFGDPRFRSGINHYVRSNVVRLSCGATRVDDGPTVTNLGDYTVPTMTATSGAQKIHVAFDVSDDWVGEDGAYLVIYGSRMKSVGTNYFKGPYRKTGMLAGDSGAPLTSPHDIDPPYTLSAGLKMFWRSQVTRADGRLSADSRGFCHPG